MTDLENIAAAHPWFEKYICVYSMTRSDWLAYQIKHLEKSEKIIFPGGMGVLKENPFLSSYFRENFSDFTLILESQGLNPGIFLKSIEETMQARSISQLALKIPEEFKMTFLLKENSVLPAITSRKLILNLPGNDICLEADDIIKNTAVPHSFLEIVSREYCESRFHYDSRFRKMDIPGLFLKWFEISLANPSVISFFCPEKGLLLLKVHSFFDRKIGEILFIHVLSDARNTGTGRRLVKRGLAELCSCGCRIVELKMTGENASAGKFYGKMGFKKLLDEKIFHFSAEKSL